MTDINQLTERQQEVYLFIRRKSESGPVPTFRQIAARFGLRSTNAVMDHIKRLERLGFVRRSGSRVKRLSVIR